ncbi:MAG TPA: hydrogenase 4 subunit B, partial [Alphaproteobacteria bacterium]|nr:hydrogenase 4 subunit B [Alphaproteobacteria bacterium]
MPTVAILWSIAGLFAVSGLATAIGRSPGANATVYGLSLALTSAAAVVAAGSMTGIADEAASVVLPLGLPWIGAHFRIDALSAFFLAIVNL